MNSTNSIRACSYETLSVRVAEFSNHVFFRRDVNTKVVCMDDYPIFACHYGEGITKFGKDTALHRNVLQSFLSFRFIDSPIFLVLQT